MQYVNIKYNNREYTFGNRLNTRVEVDDWVIIKASGGSYEVKRVTSTDHNVANGEPAKNIIGVVTDVMKAHLQVQENSSKANNLHSKIMRRLAEDEAPCEATAKYVEFLEKVLGD